GSNTDVITAMGSDTTQGVMQSILAADGTAGKTFNILAGNFQSTPKLVPADAHCYAKNYHNKSASSGWPTAGSGQTSQSISIGTTNGSNTITSAGLFPTSGSNAIVGDIITAAGIPSTVTVTVTGVTNANTATISANATATATVTSTITEIAAPDGST